MTVRYKQTTTTVQVDTVRVHDEQNIVCNCVYLKESSQTCDLQHSRPTFHRLLHTNIQTHDYYTFLYVATFSSCTSKSLEYTRP